MAKKSINRKEARKFINDSREQGTTDQEIYNELSLQYFDKKSIALLVTGTATPAAIKQYKIYNNVLLGLLLITIIMKIMIMVDITFETGQLLFLLLIFLVPLLNIYFVYEIARFNAPVYRLCAIFAFIGFVNTADKEDMIGLVINLILCCAIAGLAFYLDDKLFPNFTPRSLKKDENDEYILN